MEPKSARLWIFMDRMRKSLIRLRRCTVLSMKITMNLWIYIATVFRRNIYLQQVFHGAKRRKQLSQIILLHLNKKNTDIYFATSLWGQLDVFRGDADQDRPS